MSAINQLYQFHRKLRNKKLNLKEIKSNFYQDNLHVVFYLGAPTSIFARIK